MFKVLIIDDEPIIRKGLKNIIDWRNFGCEVCGEAADGLDGREMIKKLLPDIIITDIRMPEADGLSMIREIKDIVPESKIIILTGHREFDYAHEALKIGIFDFLLKPSKIEEITSVISRAVKELKFRRERAEEFEKLNRLFMQNISVLRERLLYDVIYGINTDEKDILQKLELFNFKVKDFHLLVVQNDEDEGGREISQRDRHLYQFGIINTFGEVFSDMFEIAHITLNNIGIAFLVMPLDGGTGNDQETLGRKCAYLQDIIRNCFGFTVSIAISSKGTAPTQLPQKFNECREALQHKFYLGNDSVIFHNDIETFFKYDDHSMLEKHQRALIEGIKSGNETSVGERLKDILSYMKSMEPAGKDFIKGFFRNTISSIYNIRTSLMSGEDGRRPEFSELTGLYDLVEKCTNMDDLYALLEDSAWSVTRKVRNYNNRSIKLVLRKAVEYLQEHYHEQVTLNEVARHLFVSTCYISRMFTRELGKSFVDCLNEIRMEKARELLKDVRLKTYEVAEKVGIPDAHYFSRIFKKYTGVTPTEYRERS
ncbi:MAG: response regulator transcription factor [Bacillota bacterium]